MPVAPWPIRYYFRAVPNTATIGLLPVISGFAANSVAAIPVKTDRPSVMLNREFDLDRKAINAPVRRQIDISSTDDRPSIAMKFPWFAMVNSQASNLGGIDFLYALFQKVVVAPGPPNVYAFTPFPTNVTGTVGGAIALEFPHLLEIIRNDEALSGDPKDQLIFSAAPSQITFTRENGLLTCAAEILGLGAMITGQALAAAAKVAPDWNGPNARSKHISNLYIKVGGVTRQLQEWNIQITNGLEMYNYQRTTPQAFVFGVEGMDINSTLSFAMDSAALAGLHAAYTAKTSVNLKIFGPNANSDAVGVDGDFLIDVYGVITSMDPGSGTGQQLTQITHTGSDDGTNGSIIVKTATTPARAW